MRVLITGGFGYLGGRIACYFVEQGAEVIISSRKYKEQPDWCPSAKVVNINWDNPHTLRAACVGIDLVIHAAGINFYDCQLNPSKALLYNGVATAALVEAAVSEKVTRFIFLSTSHVYSDNLSGFISEETCTQNIHPYATSNRAGENSVLFAHANGTIQGIVLRLSNIIGAPSHKDVNVWELLTNDLCFQAVTAQKMVLQSSGQQYRNFFGLKSFLLVLSQIISRTFINSTNTVFNVGNNYSMSVIDMAKLIKNRCDLILTNETIINISPQNKVKTQTEKLIYSNEKIKNLGISIKSELEDDIDSIINFCKINFSNPL